MIHRALALLLVVAVVAALGAGCGTNPFEPPGVNNDEDPTVWAPQALPDGYELCGLDRRTGAGPSGDGEGQPHLEVYADLTLDDPYGGPLVWVVAIEVGRQLELFLEESSPATTPDGMAVLAGPASEFQLARLPAEAGTVLTWRVGDDVGVQLAGRGVSADELLAVADHVELDGLVATLPADALPEGFGSLGDVYELERRRDFLFGLDYRPAEVDGRVDDQLTLLGSTGTAEAMEAFRFRVATSERIEVQGRPGVAADVGSDGTGPYVVSWLADDGLVLRLFSFELGTERLRQVAGTVRPLDDGALDQLVDTIPDPPCDARE